MFSAVSTCFGTTLYSSTQMRFTLIDEQRTLTFQAPPHALKAIAAACANGATTIQNILSALERYDGDLARTLRDQLGVYQEHNVPGDTTWIRARLADNPDYREPVVVLDDTTRELSLQPAKLGLILFNLPSRRIVQVENHYAGLERSDRGRVRRNGMPTRALYHYTLPDDWQIVP